MKTGRLITLVCLLALTCTVNAQDEKSPYGKYCMSFITKTRTAATVGENRLSIALKVQHFDWDEVKSSDGSYHDRASGQSKERLITTLCLKWGWAKNHHIALGIPYWSNDFDLPKSNDSAGIANIYIFEKWRVIDETATVPAVAFDVWYYCANGDPDRKIGIEEDTTKLTAEISKAFGPISLHANPGYAWGNGGAPDMAEFNFGMIYKLAPSLWPAIEYNYFEKEEAGHSSDIVPGIIWKPTKTSSVKVGVPFNVDSTFTDRDAVGICVKLFKKW